MPDKHYVTVKAAVWKGDKLLLQREKRSYGVVYDMPGGRIDKGEDVKKGLKREINEEIGVDVKWISDNPVRVWSLEHIKGDGIVCLVYEVALDSENFIYNNIWDKTEVLEAKFMSKEELEEITDYFYKDQILDYIREKTG